MARKSTPKPRRQTLSKRLRFEIFKRDQFKCVYCGRTPPSIILCCDHVLAVANGGTNEEHNLVTSCIDCNQGKSDHSLDSIPDSTIGSLAQQKEKSEQLLAANEWLRDQRLHLETICNDLGNLWWNNWATSKRQINKYTWGINPSRSVMLFLRKLPAEKVREAIDISLNNFGHKAEYKTWKYFCAVAWNMIRESEGKIADSKTPQ